MNREVGLETYLGAVDVHFYNPNMAPVAHWIYWANRRRRQCTISSCQESIHQPSVRHVDLVTDIVYTFRLFSSGRTQVAIYWLRLDCQPREVSTYLGLKHTIFAQLLVVLNLTVFIYIYPGFPSKSPLRGISSTTLRINNLVSSRWGAGLKFLSAQPHLRKRGCDHRTLSGWNCELDLRHSTPRRDGRKHICPTSELHSISYTCKLGPYKPSWGSLAQIISSRRRRG